MKLQCKENDAYILLLWLPVNNKDILNAHNCISRKEYEDARIKQVKNKKTLKLKLILSPLLNLCPEFYLNPFVPFSLGMNSSRNFK